MKLISMEANISAGKTTILELLAASGADYFIETEPIDVWQNFYGFNVLKSFYENPESNALMFQSLVELTFTKASLKFPQDKPVISERSFETSVKVFMELAYQNRYIKCSEKFLLEEWYEVLKSKFHIEPTHFIYLRVPAEVCFQRMKKREREEENEVVLEYLQKIESLTDDWLLRKKNVSVIDGNRTQEEIKSEVVSIINQIV